MIRVNELRIGNLFQRPSGDLVQVSGINTVGFEYSDFGETGVGGWHSFNDGKYLQPIALTEDWMKRFGLKYSDWSDAFKKKDNDIGLHFRDGAIVFINHDDNYDGVEIKSCKSVHQLQNLYFALTGQELTVAP